MTPRKIYKNITPKEKKEEIELLKAETKLTKKHLEHLEKSLNYLINEL